MINFSVFSKTLNSKWTRHEWQEQLKPLAVKRNVRKLKKKPIFESSSDQCEKDQQGRTPLTIVSMGDFRTVTKYEVQEGFAT
jgi:hypothetical protein